MLRDYAAIPCPVKKKCVACAQLIADQARELHGEGEKENCWDDKKWPSKRFTYRHRQRRNKQRRLKYQQQFCDQATGAEPQAETVSLPVAAEQPPYANLYIWREKQKDAPIHAIAASVFANGKKVLEVAPIHCAGYRRCQLENYRI